MKLLNVFRLSAVLLTSSLHQFGAKSRELVLCDRSRLFKAVELLKLVGGAESNNVSQLVARLLGLLVGSLRHSSTLE